MLKPVRVLGYLTCLASLSTTYEQKIYMVPKSTAKHCPLVFQ